MGGGREAAAPPRCAVSWLAGAAAGRAPFAPALPPRVALLLRQEGLPAGSGRQAGTDPQILPDGSPRDHPSCS